MLSDLVLHLVHRETTSEEHAFLAKQGPVSETASMRAMAYAMKNAFVVT